MAALPRMLEHDRKRAGWSVGQAAWRHGVSVREYQEIEAGDRWPNGETFNRICAADDWAERFVTVMWRPCPGTRARASIRVMDFPMDIRQSAAVGAR